MPRKVVVIPTFNERENIPLIVPVILGQDPEIEVLVVDGPVAVTGPDDTAVVVVAAAEVLVAAEVVVSATCSTAPASGAVPRKMSRIAFMLSPLICGISTDAPLLFAPVACTWYVWMLSGAIARSKPANLSMSSIETHGSSVSIGWRCAWAERIATSSSGAT